MDIRNHIPRLHQREEKVVCRHNMCAALTMCVCVCVVCVCVCVNVWVMHRDNKMLSWSCSLLHLELERVKVTYCFSCLLQTLPRAVIQKACSQADICITYLLTARKQLIQA